MRFLAAWLAFASLIPGAAAGNKVSYIGGTIAGVPGHSQAEIDVASSAALSLHLKNKAVSIAWSEVTTIEYGLHVDRRYIEAVLISPLFLLAKKRSHFITFRFTDGDGRHQAVVLEVGKGDVRQLLVSLEARNKQQKKKQKNKTRKAGK